MYTLYLLGGDLGRQTMVKRSQRARPAYHLSMRQWPAALSGLRRSSTSSVGRQARPEAENGHGPQLRSYSTPRGSTKFILRLRAMSEDLTAARLICVKACGRGRYDNWLPACFLAGLIRCLGHSLTVGASATNSPGNELKDGTKVRCMLAASEIYQRSSGRR